MFAGRHDRRLEQRVEVLEKEVARLRSFIERPGARGPVSDTPAGSWPTAAGDPTAEIWPETLEALRGGRKIEAIKLYRQQFRVGLAEAKDAVDRLAP